MSDPAEIIAGLPHLPYAQDLILDIIPVDMVAGVIIAATAASLAGPHKLVYQACTGDTNPLYMKQGVELVGAQTAADNRRKKKKGRGGSMGAPFENAMHIFAHFMSLAWQRVGSGASNGRPISEGIAPS